MKKNQKSEGPQRFSTKRKVEVVLRTLRGESLDELSRELCVEAYRISEWRDDFLRAGEASMKSRDPDERDDQIKHLKTVIGEITVRNEILLEGVRKWKAGSPFFPGRWQS